MRVLNSLILKIAVAKAPIAPVLNRPLQPSKLFIEYKSLKSSILALKKKLRWTLPDLQSFLVCLGSSSPVQHSMKEFWASLEGRKLTNWLHFSEDVIKPILQLIQHSFNVFSSSQLSPISSITIALDSSGDWQVKPSTYYRAHDMFSRIVWIRIYEFFSPIFLS